MVVLGVILAIAGAVTGAGTLMTIGVLLILVGLFLNFVPVGDGPRRRYW